MNMSLCEKLNLDRDTYSVSIPLGATVNMAGAAITITVLYTGGGAYTQAFRLTCRGAAAASVVSPVRLRRIECGKESLLLIHSLQYSAFRTIISQVIAVGFIIGVLRDSAKLQSTPPT